MTSIFTKIIRGEIPCEKIHESNHAIAFLDIAPYIFGHTLVVAKREEARLENLPSEEAAALMNFMQEIAGAVSQAYDGCDYNAFLYNGPDAGQEVPHLHFHIIPRPPGVMVNFRTRLSYTDDERQKTGSQIRACLKKG
ncbi:MAG: HIT family protein [SAR324 cluster bacterium]|nr:HIT family protein [SAR324 cluster bacterium]